MLPFRKNHDGVLGLSLANLGLFLASGLLLTVILNGAYGSLWERSAELATTARIMNTCLETLNAAYNDTRLTIRITPTIPHLRVTVSTEFMRLSTPVAYDTTLTYTEAWRIRPWPRDNHSWQSGDDLHEWLTTTYGHTGAADDPVNLTVLASLNEEQRRDTCRLASTPLEFSNAQLLVAEKITIYALEANATFFVLYQHP